MNKKFIGGVVGGTLILLALGMWGATRLAQTEAQVLSATDGAGQVELGEKKYDFGEVTLNGGKIEKVFAVKNSGDGELTLGNVSTSCMCTTAQVKTSEDVSPVFGMHDKTGWQGKLGPGETAEVKVIFDPAFHGPQGRGAITRIVKFQTSDPARRSVELTLTGVVK